MCMVNKQVDENKCKEINMQCMIPVRGPPPSYLKASDPRLLDEDSRVGTLFYILFLICSFYLCFVLSSFGTVIKLNSCLI
jgi:hypothetical protein